MGGPLKIIDGGTEGPEGPGPINLFGKEGLAQIKELYSEYHNILSYHIKPCYQLANSSLWFVTPTQYTLRRGSLMESKGHAF